ncbi:MAG: C39 family peptidase [Kiritimatiellae bacterium]|nr:C39 family peptidase [Kiritimatiellia bacterium]
MKSAVILATIILATPFLLIADKTANRQLNYFADGNEKVKSKDYAAAARKFLEGVNAGDPASMDYMGWLYLEGLGLRQSTLIAEGYFREAAAGGSAQACRNLGNIFYDGRAAEPSVTQAIHWWQLAADRGAPRAAFSLATILYCGIEVERDQERALKLWRQAAQNGATSSAVALIYAQANEELSKIDLPALEQLVKKGCSAAKNLQRAVELRQANQLTAYIPTAFEQQAHNFCAIASTTMLLKASGLKISHFDLARSRENHQWTHGSRWTEMAECALKHGRPLSIHSHPYTDEGFVKGVSEITAELDAGRPVVIDVLATAQSPSAHSILLTGYSKESAEYVFRNSALPFPGVEVMTAAKFKELWRSKGFIPDNNELLRPYMKLNPS